MIDEARRAPSADPQTADVLARVLYLGRRVGPGEGRGIVSVWLRRRLLEIRVGIRRIRRTSSNSCPSRCFRRAVRTVPRQAVVGNPTRQHLVLEGDKDVAGIEGAVRIAAHRSSETTLSFKVDEDQEPVALELVLKGKKVTLELTSSAEAEASS